MNEKGFTIVEVLLVAAVVGIFASLIGGVGLNNRGATERRAMVAAKMFISQNGMKVKRITCAGDSGGDGYGTCSVLTSEGEKIFLQCPTGFFDTKLFGATQCKEVYQNFNFSVQ